MSLSSQLVSFQRERERKIPVCVAGSLVWQHSPLEIATLMHDSGLQETSVCLAFWRPGKLHGVTAVRVSGADLDSEVVSIKTARPWWVDENPEAGVGLAPGRV